MTLTSGLLHDAFALVYDTDLWTVAGHLHLDCCMTLTDGLLHDNDYWTPAWGTDSCLTQVYGLTHETDQYLSTSDLLLDTVEWTVACH
jgi:hypothetical protein